LSLIILKLKRTRESVLLFHMNIESGKHFMNFSGRVTNYLAYIDWRLDDVNITFPPVRNCKDFAAVPIIEHFDSFILLIPFISKRLGR